MPTPTTTANLTEKLQRDARYLARGTHSPDDLFQESLLYHLQHRQEQMGHTPAFARRRCFFELQHILTRDRRRSARHLSLEYLMDDGQDFPAENQNPEDLFIQWETEHERRLLARRVQQAVHSLPAAQRRIVRMRADGQRPSHIARRLNVSPANITQTIKRARAFLLAAIA